jgi:uncharacterized membrane protein YkvA (DUF1232 family)
MIKAVVTGRYDGKARLAAMVLAGVYIASPIDLIPDFLVPIGLLDDSAVAVWLAGAILSETERFLLWEREQAGVVPGRVRAGLSQPSRSDRLPG